MHYSVHIALWFNEKYVVAGVNAQTCAHTQIIMVYISYLPYCNKLTLGCSNVNNNAVLGKVVNCSVWEYAYTFEKVEIFQICHN